MQTDIGVTKNPFLEVEREVMGEQGGAAGAAPPLFANAKPLPKVKKDALGDVGAVLLPLEKLKLKSPRGHAFEQEIHEFLLANFNGYTVSSGNIAGHWKDDRERDHYGEHREYKVALPHRESVASLEAFLAELAREMGEECIYLELGREIFLVYRST